MANERRDQAEVKQPEWDALIAAINQLHGAGTPLPAYRDFVKLHVEAMSTAVGMTWEVHTMEGMGVVGTNFLAWHRRYLRSLEERLQQAVKGVTIPYWDWTKERAIPAALSDRALLASWSVERGEFEESLLPTQGQVNEVLALSPFTPFQRHLEALHGAVHNAVGGDMAGPASPTDPVFFLHHANIDRLWAQWQTGAKATDPPDPQTQLQPPGKIISGTVSDVLDIEHLGYEYV